MDKLSFAKISYLFSLSIIIFLFFQSMAGLFLGVYTVTFNSIIKISLLINIVINIFGLIFGIISLFKNENRNFGYIGVVVNSLSIILLKFGFAFYYILIFYVVTLIKRAISIFYL